MDSDPEFHLDLHLILHISVPHRKPHCHRYAQSGHHLPHVADVGAGLLGIWNLLPHIVR